MDESRIRKVWVANCPVCNCLMEISGGEKTVRDIEILEPEITCPHCHNRFTVFEGRLDKLNEFKNPVA